MVGVDHAFLRSLERPLILWLLSREPRHGYDILKELHRLTGRGVKPSLVYPFLHRLEEESFTISEWIRHRGRRIKRYRLTRRGESLLERVRALLLPLRELLG
jgi:DNA-binding PadR family transcriptional regulator